MPRSSERPPTRHKPSYRLKAALTQKRLKNGPLAAPVWYSYSRVMRTFDEVLESADELSLDQKESLVSVLRHRVAEQRRAELVRTVKEARREFRSGRCQSATPAQILKKLIA
jgi:hypothetical protein